MNWTDWAVLAMIAGFGIIGMANGFIMSMFRLASFFVSAFLAVKFYPVMAGVLEKTSLYSNIWNKIYKSLLLKQQTHSTKIDSEAKKAAVDTVVGNLHVPNFLKDTIKDHLPNPSKLIDMDSIARAVSTELTKMIIGVISLILLYFLIRIGLIFLKVILQGVAKLPLFKQVNKLGGFAFGAVEGILTIYIVCAVIMLFQASPKFQVIYQAIDSSVIAKYFYQNNLIVNFMFPGK